MTKTINNSKAANPFVFDEQINNDSNSRKLDLTPQLITLSNTRAVELMRTVGQRPELIEPANLALDRAETTDVINLINLVYDEAQQQTDAEFLMNADEDQLSRLLESRRSDRSKAKSKGPRSSMTVCQTFISSMYAEMLVRIAMNKPYQATAGGSEIDYDELESDQDALNRKIRSLQSKQSRLRKTAEFVPADAETLAEVMTEIDRLKALRVSNSDSIVSKSVIKNVDADVLRAALGQVNLDDVDAETAEKIQKLMSQIG